MTDDAQKSRFRSFALIALVCLLFVLACTWIWVVKEPMYYLDREYPIWVAKSKLAQQNLSGKLVVLGDSRPLVGIIPDRIGSNVVNLALPGSTSIELYYFARRLLANSQRPGAIVISLSPIHFVQAETFFWSQTMSFGYLSPQEANEVRLTSRALKDESIFGPNSPGDIDARLKSFLYTIKFPSYFFPALYASRLYQRHAANEKMLQTVLSTRGQTYFGNNHGSTEPDFESALTSFVPSPLLDDYFNRLLSLLQANNIPVYFLNLPHNTVSDKLYFRGLKEAFVTHLDSFTGRYPDFHVLGDPFPVYPSECFTDHAHLNELGATRWSDHVAQLFQESKIPGGPFVNATVASP